MLIQNLTTSSSKKSLNMSNIYHNAFIINRLRKIKHLISQTSCGTRVATKIQKTIFRYWFKNKEDLFTYYYKTNKWGNNESLSGPGSSLAATLNIRTQLPKIIQELNIQKFLDAPCGDFNWFKLIPIPPDTEYIGGDIVKKVIELNNQQYGKKNIKFIQIDILNEELTQADLWLCRDALFHFSNSDILKVLSNFKRNKIKYFLTTTFPETETNQDIVTGDYRPINLEKPPFNLPAPLRYIDDSDAGYYGKKLGLWVP